MKPKLFEIDIASVKKNKILYFGLCRRFFTNSSKKTYPWKLCCFSHLGKCKIKRFIIISILFLSADSSSFLQQGIIKWILVYFILIFLLLIAMLIVDRKFDVLKTKLTISKRYFLALGSFFRGKSQNHSASA